MCYIGTNSVSQNIYYPPWNLYDATPDGYPRTLQRFFPGKDMAATEPQPTSKLCQWCSEATCECSNRFKLVATALTNPSKVRPRNLHESFRQLPHMCCHLYHQAQKTLATKYQLLAKKTFENRLKKEAVRTYDQAVLCLRTPSQHPYHDPNSARPLYPCSVPGKRKWADTFSNLRKSAS